MRRSLLLIAAALAGLLFAAVPPAVADKADKADKAEEEKTRIAEEYMANLALVARLKEIGYDKQNPAPEALVTAAFVLRKIEATSGLGKLDEKPQVERTTGAVANAPLVDEQVTPNYQREIRDLLDDARTTALTKKIAIEPLIKDMMSRELPPAGKLVIGGARAVSRRVGAFQTHTLHIKAKANQPFFFAFRSSAPMRVLIVRGGSQTVYAAGITTGANTAYVPLKGTGKGGVPFSIKVTNVGRRPAVYQMVVR
jgi:hypothetical protein